MVDFVTRLNKRKYELEYSVLNQGVHDGSVDVTEELSSVLVSLADDDETVVVQYVAVEVVRRAAFLASWTGTLRKFVKIIIFEQQSIGDQLTVEVTFTKCEAKDEC